MRNAKLPILFVTAVVGFLVAGALGLVAVASWPKQDDAASAAQSTRATQAPTGSSITAATPQPLPYAEAAPRGWPRPDAPTTTSSFPTPSARPRSPSSPAPTARGTPMTVSYSVTGAGSATVLTYWRGDHDIASEHGTALPWSRTVTLTDQGVIRLSAQVDSGDAHCQIALDGQIVAEAAGAYFVSCETTLRPAAHDQ